MPQPKESRLAKRMSINRRLTLIILSCLILTAFMALLQGYETSIHEAEKQLDQQLHSVSKVLLGSPINQWTEQHDFYAKLWQGENVLFSAKLLATLASPCAEEGFSTRNIAGQRLRVLVTKVADRCLLLAEPVQKRFALTETLIVSAMTPLVLVMPLLALFIAWYVRRALTPLTVLSRELQFRKANDFQRLQTASEDAEIAPVIERLNSLFTKVEAAYLRERYFASDAAHELKTPISSLKINLHNLSEQLPDNSSIAAMEQGLMQLGHIVEQMLTLARTEPDTWKSQFTSQDLFQLTQQLVAAQYDKIAEKNQQISLTGENVVIYGCEFTLHTLLGNLLSNAIKYTPKGGEILLQISTEEGKVKWQISDSGPGMTEQQISRVFDRFYRVGGDKHPSGEKGAGLGMAIVAHIVAIYKARIELSKAELGGLKVQVWFNKEAP
ncbi:sensor histidine kinase [Pseudoalteromonas fenneropenaei]|uniref:histidine kinase n=1 Tax=Pseudoalteromonas fenneropenaei TaxID=1737459 RepID=A0ABV7CG30_9GAMM